MDLQSIQGLIQSNQYATMNDLLFQQFGFQVLGNNIHEENTDTYPILVQSVLRESDVEIWGGFCVHAYIVKLDFQKTPGQPDMCLAILLKNKYTPDVIRLGTPFKLQAYHLQWIQDVLDEDLDGMPGGSTKEIPFIAMYDAVELSETERIAKDIRSWKEMNLVQKSIMPVISREQDRMLEKMETTSTVNKSALRGESYDLSPSGDGQVCQVVPINTVHMNNHSDVEPFPSNLRDDSQKRRIDGQNLDAKDVSEGIIKTSQDCYISADLENIPNTDVETKIHSEKSRIETGQTYEKVVPEYIEGQIKEREEIECTGTVNQSAVRKKSHDASQPITRQISSIDGQAVQEEADLNTVLQEAHNDSHGCCEDDNMEQMNNNFRNNKRSEETDNIPDSDFGLLKTNAEHFMEELQGDVSDSNTAATKALAVTSQPTETKEVLHSDTEGNSSSDADSSYHPKTESDCNKHYTPRTRKSNRPRAASDKALGVASYYREMENDSDEEYTRQTRKSNRRRASSDKALGDTSYYPETENDSYDEYTPQTRKSNWQRATSGKALKTRKKRKEKFKCEDCEKSFRMEKRYSLHMEWHKNKGHKKRRQKTNVRDNQCRICGTQYTTMTALKAHLTSKHPGEKSYTCEICGASFVTNESKYRHITEIHGDSMLQCDRCDMAFRSSGALGQHKKTKHIPLELWNHHCDVCSRRFPYKSVLQTHMKSHSDEKTFHCQLCGKGFKKKNHYVRHVKNHEGEKPYMCEHCGKNFGRKEHLMQHSVVHTKEKNFLCDYCGKSFSNKANLYVHRRQHTGVRPVVCKICGQGFHRQRYLAKHMEKIHANSMTQSNDIGTHDNATTDAVSQIL